MTDLTLVNTETVTADGYTFIINSYSSKAPTMTTIKLSVPSACFLIKCGDMNQWHKFQTTTSAKQMMSLVNHGLVMTVGSEWLLTDRGADAVAQILAGGATCRAELPRNIRVTV